MPFLIACRTAGTTAFPSLACTTKTWYWPVVIASWICETCVCELKFGSKNFVLAPQAFASCWTPFHVACANEFAAAKPKNATDFTLLFEQPAAGLAVLVPPPKAAAASATISTIAPDVPIRLTFMPSLLSLRMDFDSVDLTCRLRRHVPVANVASDVVGKPIPRIPEPAAATGHQADHIAAPQSVPARLQEPLLPIGSGIEHDDRGDGVSAAVEPPGGRLRALEPQRHMSLFAVDGVLADDAVPAAPAACSARVGAEAVVRHPHRVLRLEHLDRQVLQRAVDVVDEPVLSVAALPGAPAADGGLEVEPRAAVPVVDSGDADHHRVAVARPRRLLGQHVRQRLDDEVDEQAEGGEVPLARIGLLGAEERAAPDLDRERSEGTAVGRVVGVDEQLVRDAARGDGLRLAAVGRAASGVVARAQVDGHLLAADLDRQAHPHRLVARAVVVEAALGTVDAVRDRSDGGALEALGLREDVIARCVDRLLAVPGQDRLQAALPGPNARDLRSEVADGGIAEAAVTTEQVGHVAPLHACFDDLDRAEPDPLLVDLGR